MTGSFANNFGGNFAYITGAIAPPTIDLLRKTISSQPKAKVLGSFD